MLVTLKVLIDVYDKPDETTKVSKLIKRNVQYLKQFETTNMAAEQYVSARGVPSNKWTLVKEGDTYFRVNHRFEDIEKLTKRIKVKGFKE